MQSVNKLDAYLLLHGKGSGPSYPACAMTPVAGRMLADGLLYDYSAHTWAIDDLYFYTYEDSIASIQAARDRLIAKGATRIHIIGHSIGANIALYYATLFNDFTSIVTLAPAHNTHLDKFNYWSIWSRNKAMALLAQGNNQINQFVDVAMNEIMVVNALPAAYLSYLDPAGNSSMTANAKKIAGPISIFTATGSADMTQVDIDTLIYNHINKTAHSKYLATNDNHITVCLNTYQTWVNWTRNVPT